MAIEAHENLLHVPDGRRDPTLIGTFLRVQPKPRIDTAPKGKTLIQEDDFADHSMLLLEGWIAFSKMLPDGGVQIIDVMLPGDFALIGAANAPVAACSVEALSDVRYINIRAVHANGPEPDMARLRELMAAEVVRTQSRTSELLLRMGRGNASNRVAYALLEFYIRLEVIGLTRGNTFDFPMTQHKLGEFTGLSNVHVCRTLRRLERDGIIAYPAPHEISLCDLDALCELSGIDLDTFRNEILARRTP
ncbi:Crp/Fnr family transcriptional regulator [Roseovarius sp. SCSIO 43702]|uniref:Crp/Fnr family transcriptional regulator n=1 Tax=Roseovarius sp. SCSIO 43702 TaxID=2823043 RepID=UPI001C7391AA|nr:Crp/Fnr family transcriptional regulator [Roseovarius sp. SCSIO 43702]QYX56449.1 Crp/Fnr family transcriptional regulator [Roseovarius sp. SCSIO 43702]